LRVGNWPGGSGGAAWKRARIALGSMIVKEEPVRS
jgi:hypothetical protein